MPKDKLSNALPPIKKAQHLRIVAYGKWLWHAASMAKLSNLFATVALLAGLSCAPAAFAQYWSKAVDEGGVCTLVNGETSVRLLTTGQVDLWMLGANRRTNGRQISIDRVIVGRPKYGWDGYLELVKAVHDTQLLKLLKAGNVITSGQKQISLVGFTATYQQCSFAQVEPEELPEKEVTNKNSPVPIPSGIKADPCSGLQLESQARCTCETQGFAAGTPEFLICFQSALERANITEKARIQAELTRQNQLEQDLARQQQAETEEKVRKRKALGQFLRGLGQAIAQLPPPSPPRMQQCTSQWVGNTLSTTCF